MTPGTYLRKRREAAGLTIIEVAARLTSEPRTPEHERAAFLETIEADAVSPTITTLAALCQLYAFDVAVLARLAADPAQATTPVPPICRACACSDFDPCVYESGITCGWAEPDLCTFCARPPKVQAGEAMVRA